MSTALPETFAALERGRRQGWHLGGQVYISVGGRAVADAGFGEVRPGEPMTAEHLMSWLSSTKPIVAVALARQWEAGRVSLDDPVARHFPDFAAHGKDGITIRHLLTHTGGIRKAGVGWPEKSWQEIVAGIAADKPEPRWVPGRRAGYHQAASWFILGEILRRLTGRPFAELMREEIFEPGGMEDSWIGMSEERARSYGDRLAPMFATAPQEPIGEPRDVGLTSIPTVTRPSPGGNGRGPARELARFYERLLTGGSPWITEQTVEALTARHRVGFYDRTFRHVMDWGLGFIPNSARHESPEDGTDIPYGYGPHASPRTYGHSGFRSSVAFADPEHSLAVALVLNGFTDDTTHRARMRELTALIYEDLGLADDPGDAA